MELEAFKSFIESIPLKQGKNPTHLEPIRQIFLDKSAKYTFYSYDAEKKSFIIMDERYKEGFHISKAVIDRLIVLQRHFDQLCKQYKCHAVTTCERRVRLHKKHARAKR